MKISSDYRLGQMTETICVNCRQTFSYVVEIPFLRAACSPECMAALEVQYGFAKKTVTDVAEETEARKRLRLRQIGVSSEYMDAKWSDFGDIEKPKLGRGIMIRGANGRGKTRMACAIIVGCSKQGMKCQLISANKYLKRIRASYSSKRGENEMDILAEFVKPEILVIDDLGAEKVGDFGLAELLTLIEDRCFDRKTTIVTTNLDPVDIYDVEPRLGSRLRAYQQIVLKGEDYRARLAGRSDGTPAETYTN